jgi:RHS repeat-associated protein
VSRQERKTSRTEFIYDGMDVIQDRKSDGSGTSVVNYVNGLGIDDKLKQTAGSSTSYFLTDHLGSTVGLADQAGSITSQTSYDSFGNASSALPTRYGYTGREYDEYTGLMYYRARFYDPQIGRFISEDPIGFEGGDVNLYGYVWSNPLSYRDPLGLDGWGNDTADWLDERIRYAQQSYYYSDQEWIQNGVNDSVAQVLYGLSDLLRVGSGLGHAIYAEDENGYGRAAFVMMDVGRAAGLFTLFGGVATRFSGGVRGGPSPKACKVDVCFIAGTLVQTKDGEKPIEEVKEGDEVLSFDEETRQVEYKPVVRTFVRYSPILLSVYVEGESEPIGVTPEHPFYVHRARDGLMSGDDEESDEGEWVGAGELRVDDKVRLASGRWTRVIGVERRFGGATVYNFEVADNHNYFVGQLGALVHNECKFTYADVEEAIKRLESRGINPSAGQTHIDPDHVINLANAMQNDTFKPPTGFRDAMSRDASGTILQGHHRQIAGEMTGTQLPVRNVPGSNPAGSWSQIPRTPGRR